MIRLKSAVLLVSGLGAVLVMLNVWNVKSIPPVPTPSNCPPKPTYAVLGKKLDSGYLEHVYSLLERGGYTRVGIDSDWDLLWAHEYPFRVLKEQLMKLKKTQKVNHFPGSGYITNKVNLATSGLPHVPIAFKIPDQKAQLINYAKKYPESLFVQKSNNHRGIRIQPLRDLDLDTTGTFVQKYIHQPLLIDGHKFDIGVYTVITSIDPLRAYVYDGDVLFRFCPEKYHPFDAGKVDKYVVGENYKPVWEMPSMKQYYQEMGFGMKESFNAYLKSLNRNAEEVWRQVDEALRSLLLSREMALMAAASRFPSSRNFFEMVRVDFVIDHDLNVFIMEANMSPNLSSKHFAPNRLLYEQVIFNVLNLVGLVPVTKSLSYVKQETEELTRQPEVAFKELAVFAEECGGHCGNCSATVCKLCKKCLDPSVESVLLDAFREHVDRHLCRRVVPPILVGEEVEKGVDVTGLTEMNQLMHYWFLGKCKLDSSWC